MDSFIIVQYNRYFIPIMYTVTEAIKQLWLWRDSGWDSVCARMDFSGNKPEVKTGVCTLSVGGNSKKLER